MKNRKWAEKIDWVLMAEIAAVCVIVIPILIISLYALPARDDLINVAKVKSVLEEKHSYLLTAVSEVIYYYKNISGYYLGAFLNFYISPFLRGGILFLRVVIFAINLFFYTSLYFFVAELLYFFYHIKDRKVNILAYLLILFAMTNNDNNKEIWTWYCVSIGYVFVVAVMFWGIICFLRAMQNNKKKYLATAALLGFLASGGSLNLTALNCGLYFIVGILGLTVYQKKKISIICFLSALTGAVINVMAPGNYIRHGESTPYPVIEALKTAIYIPETRVQELAKSSPFILLLCIFCILMIKYGHTQRNIKGMHLAAGLFLIAAGVVIVNFPVCLGYVGYFPIRCVWVQDCTIYMGLFGWTASFAEWLKRKLGEIEIRKETLLCIAVSSVLYLCNLSVVREVPTYPTVGMIKEIVSGKAAEYVAFWQGVLREIEMSESRGVVIYREEIKSSEFLLTLGIDEDIETMDNAAVASYYGKDWVYLTTEKP